LRREAHGGFGERSGETDREQSRHRAPGLLSARGARQAQLAADLGQRPRGGCADRDAAQLLPVTRRGRLGNVARLGAACRSLALRATAASARESSPRPAAPAGRRNDQRRARELQERAILPAL
jgi:hypothetical protein